jgi:hypothetical protein
MCAIYLKHGQELVEMVEAPYEAEEVLQGLLADYPNLLAGDRDDEPRRRWLLVQRELGIAGEEDGSDRWSLDHLFLDQDGVPTLVEVKRSSDTRLRREVVGQLLDYAANASAFWGLEKIRTAFENRHADPDEAAASLGKLLGGEEDPERFWAAVGVNLTAGRLRLMFVADEIPSELRRIVEFLNEQMNRTEVLALEVRQYVERGGTRLTLVPRLIGGTEAARQAKGTSVHRVRSLLGEAEVLQALRERLDADVALRMIALYEFMRDEEGARSSFGTASVTMWLGERADPATSNPISVSFYTDGSLAINFGFLLGHRSRAELTRLADIVRRIPGARRSVEGIEDRDFRMRRNMRPEEVLASEQGLEAFKKAIAEAVRPPAPSSGSVPPPE